jgi:hypothetical protein
MDNAQLVNQSSGLVEYYTDPRIVDAARELMGSITLDPASCLHANLFHVGAQDFYTKEQDGLSRSWFGNVWLNHPFHRGEQPCPKKLETCKKKVCKTRGHHITKAIPSNAEWINHLMNEFERFHIRQACAITFASTSEAWFRPLLNYPQCYLTPRTNYYTPDGLSADDVTKGSVVTYLGPDNKTEKFREIFEWKYELGVVKV